MEVLRSVGNITELDFNNSQAHLPDEEINIGHKTWAFLDAEELIDASIKKEFFSGVRKFYITVATTIIKKFSFNDTLLNDLAILFPENKTEVSRSTVSRLGRRFNAAVSDEQCDSLDEEVLDYLLLSPELLPKCHKEAGKPTNVEKLCEYWQKIGEMKTASGELRFPNLTKLFKCLLSLPHSNADTERVFSIVRKILTEQRSQLDQSTLCALIGCKLNNSHPCYQL